MAEAKEFLEKVVAIIGKQIIQHRVELERQRAKIDEIIGVVNAMSGEDFPVIIEEKREYEN